MIWKNMTDNRRKITAIIAGGSILGAGSVAVAQVVTTDEKTPAQPIVLEETVTATNVDPGSVAIPTDTLLADSLDDVDDSVDADSVDDSVDADSVDDSVDADSADDSVDADSADDSVDSEDDSVDSEDDSV